MLENICRYLIVKDDQGKWSFPHASVQEYFVEKHATLTDDNARIEVAKLSLLVLIETYKCPTATESPGPGQMSHKTPGENRDIYIGCIACMPKSIHSLEYYISENWVLQIKDIQGVPEGNKQISKLLKRFMISPASPCHSTLEYQRWLSYVVSQRNIPPFNCFPYKDEFTPATNPAFGIVVLGITLDEKEWAKTCLQLTLEELNTNGLDTLSLAARYRRDELCVSLIELGSSPARILPSGTGALDQAIISRKMASVKELLEHGADSNVDTKSRALCQAVFYGGKEMVELLLKHGALPDEICSSCDFECALEAAAFHHKPVVAETLIMARATVDLRLYDIYDTPLLAAVHSGSLEVTKLLIEHGADVNIKVEPSVYGGVLGAAMCGFKVATIIPYLIEEVGADPNRVIEDLRGRNPSASNIWRDSRREVSRYLFSKNYLNPYKTQNLEIGDYRALEQLKETAKMWHAKV